MYKWLTKEEMEIWTIRGWKCVFRKDEEKRNQCFWMIGIGEGTQENKMTGILSTKLIENVREGCGKSLSLQAAACKMGFFTGPSTDWNIRVNTKL